MNSADENIRDQVIKKCLSNGLRRKLLERGRNLTLHDLQTIARAMEASNRQAGNMENSNQAKWGLNAIHGKQERRCFRCDNTGHTQEDKKCPARNKECLKCYKVGHFAKCCKTKETKGPQKKCFTKQKGHRGTVNQVNFEDYLDDESEYAFTIVDEKQPVVLVSIGGVPNVSMIVDSGASCNVIDRQLRESLQQKKVKCVSSSHKKQLYPLWQQRTIKNGWLLHS